jgi:outer membrane protein assembly factor BamB
MQWDPSVVTVTLGGSALGKVDTAVKAVEDSGRTVVLDVTADFLPGDSLTVADLKFFSFTALATPDHLGLEVGNDDVVIAVDDKTIDIFATGVPRLSSDANQGFVVGSPPVPAVPFTISNSSPSSITAAADLRVWIPAGFLMTWNPFDTSASISGPGASKVSPVVSFENGNRTLLLDVTTDFGSSDFVTVSGLSFASFTGVSAPDELELEVDGLGGIADVDDKRIFIDGFSDVAILTATATSLRVEIQWVFPDAGACDHVHVVRDTGGFPAPLGGTLVVNAPCAGFMGMPFSAIDAPPANDVEYFYSAYVYTGVGYTPGQFVKARPFDTSGAVKWAYSTGATSMAPPGLRFSGPDSFVYVVSNDSILHGLRGGDTGGTWPAGFEPFKLGRPAQNRPPVVSFTVGSANGAAFLGSEDGNVYAVDATDGSLEWVSPVANLVVAAPAGHFTAYDVGATDLVLVGTRNGSAANALKALDVATGAPVWSFVNSLVDGEGQDIGIISGGASVDYQNQRIYFTSRQRASGSQKTLWAIDFTPSLLWNANLGNIDGSPVLVNGRVYVGTVAGAVAVRDAASGTGGWTLPLGDGAIKGFVFPRFGTNELFVSTNGKVWAIADNTTSGSVVAGWPVTSIPSPSIPLYPPPSTHLLVGSSNGKLYQIDILSPSTPTSVVLGDGSAAVGAPTLDWPNSMIYVGTDAGIIYGVLYPLP